jgi:hypothetical protein
MILPRLGDMKKLVYLGAFLYCFGMCIWFMPVCCAQAKASVESIETPVQATPASAEPIHQALNNDEQVRVTLSNNFSETNSSSIELIIQSILGACAIWLIATAFHREPGAKISIPSLLLGALILLDAATVQMQVNWWMASGGGPYEPAIGLALPGAVGGVLLLLSLIWTNKGRRTRIILALVAVAILAGSMSLGVSAWPSHPSHQHGFY